MKGLAVARTIALSLFLLGAQSCTTYLSASPDSKGNVYVTYNKGYFISESGIYKCKEKGALLECKDMNIREHRPVETKEQIVGELVKANATGTVYTLDVFSNPMNYNSALSIMRDYEGRTIDVVLSDGSKVRGKLLKPQAYLLELYDGNKSNTIDLEKVRKILVFSE
jgi:hypothetical protein